MITPRIFGDPNTFTTGNLNILASTWNKKRMIRNYFLHRTMDIIWIHGHEGVNNLMSFRALMLKLRNREKCCNLSNNAAEIITIILCALAIKGNL